MKTKWELLNNVKMSTVNGMEEKISDIIYDYSNAGLKPEEVGAAILNTVSDIIIRYIAEYREM